MHFVPIGGIALSRDSGWSDKLRRKCKIPLGNWHEFCWSDLADQQARKMSCAFWQKPFWFLFGDALAYRQSEKSILARLQDHMALIPEDEQIMFICHSWGTRVWYDFFKTNFLDRNRMYRVLLMGSAVGALAPNDLPRLEGKVINLRAMGDFISLGLKKRNSHVYERWVMSFPPHTGLWRLAVTKYFIKEAFKHG